MERFINPDILLNVDRMANKTERIIGAPSKVTIEVDGKPLAFSTKHYYFDGSLHESARRGEGRDIWSVRDEVKKDGLEPATFEEISDLVASVGSGDFELTNFYDDDERRNKDFSGFFSGLGDSYDEKKQIFERWFTSESSPRYFGFSAKSLYLIDRDWVSIKHDLSDGKLRGDIEKGSKRLCEKFKNGELPSGSVRIETYKDLIGEKTFRQLATFYEFYLPHSETEGESYLCPSNRIPLLTFSENENHTYLPQRNVRSDGSVFLQGRMLLLSTIDVNNHKGLARGYPPYCDFNVKMELPSSTFGILHR